MPAREDEPGESSVSNSSPTPATPPTLEQAKAAELAHAARLLDEAKAGDRRAYGEIAVLYQERLYNGVLRLMGDHEEAREITQEALLRGLQNLAKHRGESGPYTWLFRIAMNLAITRLRKVRRRRTFSVSQAAYRSHRAADGPPPGLDAHAADEAQGPSRQLSRRERDALVLAALGRLDADTRALVVMRDLEGFDYKQMAEVLDLPLGTLKSKLFRARLALRQELAPYFDVEEGNTAPSAPSQPPPVAPRPRPPVLSVRAADA